MKPWEKYSSGDTQASMKPWEKYSGEAPKTETSSAAEAAVAGFGQGVTFGFGEEIGALGSAAIEPLATKFIERDLPEDLKTKSDKGFVERYQEARDLGRAYNKRLQEEHPVAYTGAQIAGAIPSSLMGGAGVKGAQLLGRAALEGATYGLGESQADLTEGELKSALKDTALGAAIGAGTAGIGMGLQKGYKAAFGRGGADLATDAAGDILELTPTQRKNAAQDYIKMGPGEKPSTVAEQLPQYLREKGGFIQHTKTLKKASEEALEKSGKEIEDVLSTYEDTINALKAKRVSPEVPMDINKLQQQVKGQSLEKNLELFNKKVGDLKDAQQTKMAEDFSKEMSFKFNELADRLSQEVDQFRGHPGFENQLAKVEDYIEKLRNFKSKNTGENFIESIKELHQFRKNTDKLIKSFSGPKSTQADALLQDSLIQTRRELSNHLQDNMLGRVKNFAQEALDAGSITKQDFDNLTSLQDRIYRANRDYKLSSFVDGQIDQAIGRKDARRIISLTDWIIGSGAGAMYGPGGLGVIAAKKAGEVVRPRAQLYANEIGKVAGAVATPMRGPAIQQATESAEPDRSLLGRVRGTKWERAFTKNPNKDRAIHKILMGRDEEYRKHYLGQD